MNMNKIIDEKFIEILGIFIIIQEKQKKRGGVEIIIELFIGENRIEFGVVK